MSLDRPYHPINYSQKMPQIQDMNKGGRYGGRGFKGVSIIMNIEAIYNLSHTNNIFVCSKSIFGFALFFHYIDI